MSFTVALQSTISRSPGLGYPPLGCLREGLRDMTQLLPSVYPPHPDLLGSQQAKKQQLGRLGIGQRSLGLHTPSEFAVKPLDRVGRAKGFPLAAGKSIKCQQFLSRFPEAVGYLGRLLLPLCDKCRIGLLCQRETLCLGDPMKILPHFLQRVLGDISLKIAKLVHHAALDQNLWPALPDGRTKSLVAIDHAKLWPLQAPLDEPAEKISPRASRLTAEQIQVQYPLLPVLQHAQGYKDGYRDHLLRDPHPQGNRVQVKDLDAFLFQATRSPQLKERFEPAHHTGDRALREGRTAQQRRVRPFDTPLVGSRQIRSHQSRIHRGRSTLITGQKTTAPFHLSRLAQKPTAGNLDRALAQARAQLSDPAPVPIPLPIGRALITAGSQYLAQLSIGQRPDHLPDPLPQRLRQSIRTAKGFLSLRRWCILPHRRIPPRLWPLARAGFSDTERIRLINFYNKPDTTNPSEL